MKRLLIIIGSLWLAFSVAAFPVLAAEESDDMRVFAPVIEEYQYAISLEADEAFEHVDEFAYVGGLFPGGYSPHTDNVYAFCDINQDGTDEMLVSDGYGSEYRQIIEVFYQNDDGIGKLFYDTFNYRVGLYIGNDGTAMTSGSNGAGSEEMTVYSLNDLSAPVVVGLFSYDERDMDRGSPESTKISHAEYSEKVNDYIIHSIDYTALDWHFFVTPPEGEYDPYPKANPAVSGLYADTAMGSTMSKINFDAQDRSFILLLNLWYDWEIAEGTYSVDAKGVIECKTERLISRCYENKKVTDSAKLSPVHFLISGDKIVPVEEGLCEGQAYYRISDGFSVVPDSGTGTVTGDAVRVRSGPGTEYDIFTELFSGDQVTIIGSSGDWYRIECIDRNGALFWGFMHSDYITRN